MTNDKAIEILSKRNYMCGECPFSGPDCQGCRLASALDLAINALREKVDISNRALDLIDDLKDRGVINNHQRGTLRRAIILGDNNNRVPALVLDDLTEDDINKFKAVYQRATSKGLIIDIDHPRGKWVFKHNSSDIWCSVCDENFDEIPQKYNYCPNCGADMREPTVCGNNPGWCDNCISKAHCKNAKWP